MNNSDFIYHYTSIEAACNIITSGTMRATNVMFQNDKSEMIEALRIIKDYLTKVCNNIKNSENFVNQILKQYTTYIEKGFPIFTLSFTTKYDDLNQWRAYGNNGKGCCIGFKLDKKDFLEPKKKNLNIVTKKCIYDNAEIDKCLKEIDNRIFSDEKNFLSDIASRLLIEIFTEAPFIKHIAYKDEAEYRFAFSSEEDNNFDIQCNEKGKPYINILTNNCYANICFGPCTNNEDKEKIKYWLNQKALQVKTETSEIPYRSS